MSSAPTLESNALQAALVEVRELQRTVTVLREELEAAHMERARQVQDATATAHIELQQARATVSALRDALELARADQEAAVKQATMGTMAEVTSCARPSWCCANSWSRRTPARRTP